MAQNQVKIGYNPEICDKFDRRIMHVFNLDEKLDKVEGNPNTYEREKGSVCFVEESVKIKTDSFSLIKPEMTALYIDMSNKLFLEAITFLNKNNFDYDKGFYHVKDNNIYFTFIQNISGSIIFAINALECFCNGFLIKYKDDEILGKEKDKNGIEKELTKRTIEYWSIDKKVRELLTQIFYVQINIKIWDSFLKLKNLRDRLTHLKGADIKTGSSPVSEKNIWRLLLKQTQKRPSDIIVDLIKDLYKDKEKPRWLRLYLKK